VHAVPRALDLLDHRLQPVRVIGTVGDDHVLPVAQRLIEELALEHATPSVGLAAVTVARRRGRTRAAVGVAAALTRLVPTRILEIWPRVSVQQRMLLAVQRHSLEARVVLSEFRAVNDDSVLSVSEESHGLCRSQQGLSDRTGSEQPQRHRLTSCHRCQSLVHARINVLDLLIREIALETGNQLGRNLTAHDGERLRPRFSDHVLRSRLWRVAVHA